MAFTGVKLDPDDPFDKVVFLEERCRQEGYNAGFLDGKRAAEVDGINLGIRQGREIGREVGFYKGFVAACEVINNKGRQVKAKKLLERLKALLGEFSYENPESETMADQLDEIRAKFKQISSVLKLPTEVTKPADFSF